jgi:hypothetical protein
MPATQASAFGQGDVVEQPPQTPSVQIFERQSSMDLQPFLSAQGGHVPPQSTSVSLSPFAPSLQLGNT